MTIIKKQPLYSQVAQKILELYCMDETVRTLPSEGQLSATLGISKNTVREALAELSTQKIITKVHGVGNVVMHSALRMNFRIDSDSEFMDILTKAGYVPSIVHTPATQLSPADEHTFIPAGQYLFYSELILASGTAACQSDIFIPFRDDVPFDEALQTREKPNMFEFIQEYTDENVVHSNVFMFPSVCTGETTLVFGLKENTPLLKWNEIYYSLKDIPICYVVVSFNPNIFLPSMVRGDFFDNTQPHIRPCTVVKSLQSITNV